MTRRMVIGIDVGGTFTDVVGLDNDGKPLMFKVPSNPSDPAAAVIEGINSVAKGLNTSTEEILSEVDIVHGTTMGINTLLTRSGARTALLTTHGFRDILEMRTGYKNERYELDLAPPEPLIPRSMRKTIRERVNGDGTIVQPLDEEDVVSRCRELVTFDVEAVAICFLWSFLNPTHETRTAEICKEIIPDAFVTTSWDVLPELREYNRVSTTALNAYIGPKVIEYVTGLQEKLKALGFAGTLHFLQSHGGVAHAEEVLRVPVRTLMSGPSAGPAVATYFSRLAGSEDAICIDMGGTSFDASMVSGGKTRLSRPVEVDGVRIGLPMVDIKSVGGGGGSIAWVDTGILRVGPSSAGAVPGPASYGLGGTQATVTDANLLLGVYEAGEISGGLTLKTDLAKSALSQVGRDIGIESEAAATGVLRVLNIDLAQTVRDITVAEGRDPRHYALVVGGGSGPAHCCAVAEALNIDRIIVPKAASTLCALGALITDVVYEIRRSLPTQLSGKVDTELINSTLMQMEEDIVSRLQGGEVMGGEITVDRMVGLRYREDEYHVERGVELRYREQLWEIMVPIGKDNLDTSKIQTAITQFHERHHEIYTYSEPENVCELVSLAVRATVPREHVEIDWALPDSEMWQPVSMRQVSFAGGSTATPVFEALSTPVGILKKGPLIIDEEHFSLLVAPHWTCTLQPYGAYLLERE